MPKLIAIRRLAYGTRRLMAGDAFDANGTDAGALIAVGRARLAKVEDEKPEKAAPKPKGKAKAKADESDK